MHVHLVCITCISPSIYPASAHLHNARVIVLAYYLVSGLTFTVAFYETFVISGKETFLRKGNQLIPGDAYIIRDMTFTNVFMTVCTLSIQRLSRISNSGTSMKVQMVTDYIRQDAELGGGGRLLVPAGTICM